MKNSENLLELQRKEVSVHMRLSHEIKEGLWEAAKKRGMAPTTLARFWIAQKVKEDKLNSD